LREDHSLFLFLITLLDGVGMSSQPLTAREKERILRAVEEDREFRLALMGLLGMKEILERILGLEKRYQKLEERFARVEERLAKLEEKFAKLEERLAKVEERLTKLEERFAELEERFARLEERYQRLEERFAKLEERFAKLEERQARLEEEMGEFRRLIFVIAHRFGVISESAFREAMRYVVEDSLGAGEVERVVLEDREGMVYGHPSIVEVDVVIKDDKHIIVEIKSRVSRGDVGEVYRMGKLYERAKGVRPELVIVGGFIDRDAARLAKRLGVRIVPAVEQVV